MAEEERLAHQTTFLLQEIDGNLNQAYHVTSRIVSRVKEYQSHVKSLHSSVQIWKSFFHELDTVPDSQHNSRRMSMLSAFSSLSVKDEEQEDDDYGTPRKADASSSDSASFNSYHIQTPVLKTTRALKKWNDNSHTPDSALDYPEMLTTPYYKASANNESFDPHSTPTNGGFNCKNPSPNILPTLSETSVISVTGSDTNDGSTPPVRGTSTGLPVLNDKENTPSGQVLFTPRKKHDDDEDDDLMFLATPKMKSPLLSTKLRAMMTPKTPLSNKLAMTSTSSTQKKLKPASPVIEEPCSFNSTVHDEPVTFSLDLFPPVFQKGTGAKQISMLYEVFNSATTAEPKNLEQLNMLLPSLGTGRTELLLETLVSRHLLRPILVQDELYWEKAD